MSRCAFSTRSTTARTRPGASTTSPSALRERLKGYRVLTGLVKSNGNADKSSDVVQDYEIRHLHNLIQAGLNPRYRFEDAADISDAA